MRRFDGEIWLVIVESAVSICVVGSVVSRSVLKLSADRGSCERTFSLDFQVVVVATVAVARRLYGDLMERFGLVGDFDFFDREDYLEVSLAEAILFSAQYFWSWR